jgi:hypothetical protein
MNNKQIPPHASKEQCDNIRLAKTHYGCAQPFRYDTITGKVEKCDYI